MVIQANTVVLETSSGILLKYGAIWGKYSDNWEQKLLYFGHSGYLGKWYLGANAAVIW